MVLSMCTPKKVVLCAPVDAPVDSWRSYVVSLCAMTLQAVVFGCLNSYPNFKGQLLSDSSLNAGEDAVAWATSLATGLGPLVSILAGQVTQIASPRLAGLISVAATVLSLNLAAGFADSEASLVCLFGIFMGIAVGFMISPGPAATSTWFKNKMTLGMGITFTGGGVGSVLIPPISGAMEKVMDWRDAFHILTVFCSMSLVACLFVCIRPTSDQEDEKEEEEIEEKKPEEEEAAAGAILSPVEQVVETMPLVVDDAEFDIHVHPCHGTQWLTKAFFTTRFLALFAGYAFFSFGFYGALYAVVPFPLLMGLGGTPYHAEPTISVSAASNIFIGLGATEIVGAPLFGYLSLKIGDRFSYAISLISLAVLTACWCTCRDYWSHFLVVTLMGFFVTGFFATFGSMVAQSFYGPNLNRIMGVAYAAASIGGFAGAPAITAMVKSTGNQSYTLGLLVLAGSYLISGLIILIVIRDPAPANPTQLPVVFELDVSANPTNPCDASAVGSQLNNNNNAAELPSAAQQTTDDVNNHMEEMTVVDIENDVILAVANANIINPLVVPEVAPPS